MVLTDNFRRRTGNILANYDYNDILDGTGIVVYQGFSSAISGAKLALQKNVVPSYEVETARTDTGGYYWDFDLTPFVTAKTIKGTGVVKFSAHNASGVPVYFTPQFYKKAADGTLTSFGSSIAIAFATATNKTFAVPVALTTTKFQAGDALRIRVNLNSSSQSVFLAHDPADRDGTNVTPAATYPTKFEVFVPFKIDM